MTERIWKLLIAFSQNRVSTSRTLAQLFTSCSGEHLSSGHSFKDFRIFLKQLTYFLVIFFFPRTSLLGFRVPLLSRPSRHHYRLERTCIFGPLILSLFPIQDATEGESGVRVQSVAGFLWLMFLQTKNEKRSTRIIETDRMGQEQQEDGWTQWIQRQKEFLFISISTDPVKKCYSSEQQSCIIIKGGSFYQHKHDQRRFSL